MNDYQCIVKLVNLMKWFEKNNYDNMYNYTRLFLIDVLSFECEIDEAINCLNNLTWLKNHANLSFVNDELILREKPISLEEIGELLDKWLYKKSFS